MNFNEKILNLYKDSVKGINGFDDYIIDLYSFFSEFNYFFELSEYFHKEISYDRVNDDFLLLYNVHEDKIESIVDFSHIQLNYVELTKKSFIRSGDHLLPVKTNVNKIKLFINPFEKSQDNIDYSKLIRIGDYVINTGLIGSKEEFKVIDIRGEFYNDTLKVVLQDGNGEHYDSPVDNLKRVI